MAKATLRSNRKTCQSREKANKIVRTESQWPVCLAGRCLETMKAVRNKEVQYFYGPSGTGKTTTGQAIARELRNGHGWITAVANFGGVSGTKSASSTLLKGLEVGVMLTPGDYCFKNHSLGEIIEGVDKLLGSKESTGLLILEEIDRLATISRSTRGQLGRETVLESLLVAVTRCKSLSIILTGNSLCLLDGATGARQVVPTAFPQYRVEEVLEIAKFRFPSIQPKMLQVVVRRQFNETGGDMRLICNVLESVVGKSENDLATNVIVPKKVSLVSKVETLSSEAQLAFIWLVTSSGEFEATSIDEAYAHYLERCQASSIDPVDETDYRRVTTNLVSSGLVTVQTTKSKLGKRTIVKMMLRHNLDQEDIETLRSSSNALVQRFIGSQAGI